MTDIVDKTLRLYKPMGANFVGAPSWTWTFPSGAKIRLAYISTDKHIWEYLGPRYSFVPGRLSDHNLLDDKYVYRLRMISGSLPAAMEQGCWCELQGAYFANRKA